MKEIAMKNYMKLKKKHYRETVLMNSNTDLMSEFKIKNN